MIAPRRALTLLALSTAGALVLAGCAGSAGSADSADAALSVVASTDVYGQIAEEISGGLVEVTSIVASAAQDPHSYEATAQDQLVISKADLIIENGGGYDSFVDTLIESTGTTAPVITAAEYSHDWPENAGHDEEAPDAASEEHDDHDHAHVEGFNEHVWYDPHTIEHVAEAIAEELAALQPADAAMFEDNAAAFVAGIADLESALEEIAAARAGEGVFVTEPVPVYLTTAAGLANLTPEAFSEAVEEGQDVPPATLLESLDLIGDGSVRVVITNSQTGGAETTQISEEAERAGIPVIAFSETLPEGQTYVSWMKANIDALSEALQQ
jgi:zinc/manganese transport system substrate-binding protein